MKEKKKRIVRRRPSEPRRLLVSRPGDLVNANPLLSMIPTCLEVSICAALQVDTYPLIRSVRFASRRVSKRGHLPLEGAKLGEPAEISFVGRDHSDAQSPRAHRDQCVIGQTSLPDLFVMIPGRQASKHSPGLSPVPKIRNQDSLRPVEISLQAFYNLTIAIVCASIEFFEYDCTEPKGRIRSEPAQCQDRIDSSPECGNVNGRVEQGRLHLTTQRAVNVLDVNSALDETLSGFENQSVALVFGNRQIQRPLDGLSLGFRSQSLLGALDFRGIQLKVLVRATPCCGHGSTPFLIREDTT